METAVAWARQRAQNDSDGEVERWLGQELRQRHSNKVTTAVVHDDEDIQEKQWQETRKDTGIGIQQPQYNYIQS